MKCHSCKFENSEGAKFCSNCGSKIEIINKCPNCGEISKEGAKFCSNCGTILNGEGADFCPHCGNKIPKGAKFCKTCGKQIFGEQINNQIQSTNNKWWSDPFNWIIIGVGIIILYNRIGLDIINRLIPNTTNQNIETIKNSKNDEQTNLYDKGNDNLSDSNNSTDYRVRISRKPGSEKTFATIGNALISAIENGYSIKGWLKNGKDGINHDIICDNFDESNFHLGFLNFFKNKIHCKFIADKNLESKDDFIGIYFDNSRSENGSDKSGPEDRIKKLGEYLNDNNFKNGTKIKITFTYGTGGQKENIGNDLIGATPDNKAYYEFTINKNAFEIIPEIISTKGEKLDDDNKSIFFSQTKKKLDLFDVSISFNLSGDYNSTAYCNGYGHEYTCFDAKSVFAKFKELYEDIYSKDIGKHRGNLILNVLNQDTRYSQYTKMYIITDGEFEMGGGWSVDDDIKSIKKKSGVSDESYAKYPTTNFHLKNAEYYRDGVYEKFWDDAITTLQKRINKQNNNSALPKCINDKEVHLVGVNQSFGNILSSVYKKIFEGCTVYID